MKPQSIAWWRDMANQPPTQQPMSPEMQKMVDFDKWRASQNAKATWDSYPWFRPMLLAYGDAWKNFHGSIPYKGVN